MSELAQWPTATLIPYTRNSRTHSDAQVSQIVKSIKEFGFTNPVLIDDKGGIIAGHGRVLAATKLGLTTVPCIVLSHLSETQKRAYVIADNKLALNAGWDLDMLAIEIGDLGDLGFDLAITGFDGDELAGIIHGAAPHATTAEVDVNAYAFSQKCPKCGFEYDHKA